MGKGGETMEKQLCKQPILPLVTRGPAFIDQMAQKQAKKWKMFE